MSKKGSKNNVANRGSGAKVKKYKGEEVKAVKYIGGKSGHGSGIMAVFVGSGKLVTNDLGTPIPYQMI